MLPLQQAREVIQSIREYIHATFSFNNEKVERAFFDFIEHPTKGMIKGPYLSLKTPFISANPDEEIPLDIKPNFTPHYHQSIAFNRLTARDGHIPQHTLLTTGTGSGKTESFEYPVLDWCFATRHKRGIKVIILYPMNALATDQARRLAKDIYENPFLKDRIRVGLFIGKGKSHQNLPTTMGKDHVIEDRQEIVKNPPDILLTNFKMLDMGLMQSEYSNLWVYNLQDPYLLKFLVLDELHTYDGAQGTDVANLIRRLKLRLNIPESQLCTIGTSATLGSGEQAKEDLCKYASDIFGENITEDSIIEESRQSVEELFKGEAEPHIPTISYIKRMIIGKEEDYDSYINRQKNLWRINANNSIELGEELGKLQIVRDIVKIFTENGVLQIKTLVDKLSEVNEDFRAIKEKEEIDEETVLPKYVVLESLLALISDAKRPVGDTGRMVPFLFLQVQLWVRELSGIRRIVNKEPEFTWRDEMNQSEAEKISMPIWYCRECGASGWYMLKNEHDENFQTSEEDMGRKIVNSDKHIFLVTPVDEGKLAEDYQNNAGFDKLWISPETLEISDEQQPGYIECWAARHIESKGNSDKWINICPECMETNDTVSMIGTKTATLASLSVGQLLSSDLENSEQRKILAFTNGVQDASHDASFFEARNFRFMFRTAMQKVVDSLNSPVSLGELEEIFLDHWKNKEPGYNHRKFVYSFYPNDLEGKYPLEAQDIDSASFTREFDRRMTWEIVRELGYGANIGRTLEKTGSSATFFKEDELSEVYLLMREWFKENNREIKEEDFIQFLNGVLHRMRLRGGIDHPYLENYRKNPTGFALNEPYNGKGYAFNRKYKKGRNRWPQLVVNHHRTSNDERNAYDSTQRRNDKAPINWFHSYYLRYFKLDEIFAEPANVINDFYKRLFDALEESSIVNSVTVKDGNKNYALNPEHIYVGGNVKQIRCNECRNLINVTEEDAITKGSYCLGHQCEGSYTQEESRRMNYYYNVYHRHHVPRVFAHEHTGMLDRKKREEIEDSFINPEGKPNALNTLVATSTLEMGIDIGDLNTGINISVPPTVANFAQRIGRAGRKTGSALIVNYAKRDKPHDLFYFSDPFEMMKGEVRTPGCYLEAKEILSRHFYAFCIDSWSAADPVNHKLPNILKMIGLGSNFLSSSTFFINEIHSWINENFEDLKKRFKSQYSSLVYEIALKPMFETFKQLHYKAVMDTFKRLNDEYRGINTDIENINNEIRTRRLAKTDPEYNSLKGQIIFLKRRREGIEDRTVLEFMTDNGLLPNYAFPETGVKLSGVVKSENEGSRELPAEEFEIVRPASQAIKELAPGNSFFARHYKLEIDGLVTTDWENKDCVSEKRFCSECDYLEDASPSNPTVCPKCGSQSFGAASNIHKFVRLEAVKSWMLRKDAMADDSKDDRDRKIYKLSRHFYFDEANAKSFAMTEIPFGIQYVKKAILTDTNLGDGDVMTAQNLSINGLSNVQRHGFVVCRHCGKVTNNPGKTARYENTNERIKEWHYPYCRHKTQEYENKPDEYFEEVFLYRSFQTEAIKVLLPIGEIDTKAQVAMFKAGLMLGMREIFGGEPSHIQIREYHEMNNATGKWDNYLVIFDTIPGGSGYLEKLFKTEEFTKLLKAAFRRISECECQHNGNDGCYHCILTYANQFEKENLSREKAEELFRRIVEKSDKWEEINGTLSGINTSGGIEESELEERFIRTLKRYAEAQKGYLKVDSAFGNKFYRFKIGEIEYLIQPQYPLDHSKGVRMFTVADFLISRSDGLPIFDNIEALAIYLDGYQYHGVSVENRPPRFFHDIEQRESIILSGRFLPWTLTWEDLDLADMTGKNSKRNDSLYLSSHSQTKSLVNRIYGRNSGVAEALNSIERLIYLLEYPDNVKKDIGLMLIQSNMNLTEAMHNNLEMDDYLSSGDPLFDFTMKAAKDSFFFTTAYSINDDVLKTLIAVPSKEFGSPRYRIIVTPKAENIEKEVWNKFLRLYNLLGCFGPDTIWEISNEISTSIAINGDSIQLNELIEAYDNEDLGDMITFLFEHNVNINPDGYFVVIENNEIIADALLGSEKYKFAVTEDETAIKALVSRGYQILKPNEIDKLRNIINS